MQQNDREEQEQETGRQAIEQPNQEVEPTAAPMEERIEEERRRADSYLDLLQRTQADFVNYRR
ncbi:MAG TPA: nucleotide exchange factor GrpE, partial [Ktedonobacteraceae bacterium]|nr:nucleotide exchange factor GrpE [Ktedonobacteraceae bacterium]